MKDYRGVFIAGGGVGATPLHAMLVIRLNFNMHHWINRPWNRHIINGWGFPSHVHHVDVGGSEPTQDGAHM